MRILSTLSVRSLSSPQEPYGYSDDTAGLMGAVLLLVGLVAAAISSPLLDRVFTNHLALFGKLLLPGMAACYLALIWESTCSSSFIPPPTDDMLLLAV